MLPLTTHAHDFEGEPLLTFILDDRPCWVARHIGARLGYSHGGKRLPNKILGDWAEEFIEGHDYRLLEGAELAAFRASLGKVDGVPGRGSPLVLFEPGIYLVLAKTEQPVGKRLRRFLVDEVLPALARTGTYTVEGPEPKEAPADAPALSLLERREARLLLQAQVRDAWVSFCSRRLNVQTLHRMVEVLGDRIDPSLRCALEVLAAQLATGLPLLELLADDDDSLADLAAQLVH